MKKIINALILLFVIFITGCSGSGGSSSSGSGGSGTPISIGTLPNGSIVYISQNDLPVSNGTPAQASIYLEGGSANESYNITFTTNQQLATRLNTSESYGINITTFPTPCVIGTTGSGASSQCQVTITSSATTYPGTYVITPSATPISVSGSATTLNPLTILVSGSIKPSTKTMTSFSLNGTAGVISGQNITVTLPYGTNLTKLVATYITTGKLVKVGNVTQENGVTQNDFTNPVVYTVIAEDGSARNYTVTVTEAKNNDNDITAFSLNGTAGVIDQSNNTIAVTMPYGTDLATLIATFTTTCQSVKVNNVDQVSGVTQNNFTNPVVYTVTAEDGSSQNYTVTVTVALSSDNQMIEFSLDGTEGVIDQVNNTINVAMPYGTNLNVDLTATFITDGTPMVTIGAVMQTNGVTPNNFATPVTYTVHADNGDTRNYVVTVTTKPVISQATAINFAGSYAFLSSNVSSDITKCSVNGAQLNNCSNLTIDKLLLPQGASNISAFESTGGMTLFITGNDNPPTIVQCLLPTGAITATCSKINQADGLQANRLLLNVNGTPSPQSSAKITSFTVAGVSGLINNNSIYVTLPYGADLNGLVATFTTTGKSVKVNNIVQVSGVTSNNFINNTPLRYVVTAKDNTTSDYVVFVRWSYFAGMLLNPYASSIKVPIVFSGLESEMMNMSVIVDNGMYTGLNFGTISSFPAEMNATGLSSIALTKTTTNESYNYVMSNIAESQIYACSVTANGSGIPACSGIAVPQPSSVVAQTVAGTPFVYLYATSYHQNFLSVYFVTPTTHAIAYAGELDMSGVFNLPRSLSLSPSYSASNNYWLFALNEGDNSYAACQIVNGNLNPNSCSKTYFSSL